VVYLPGAPNFIAGTVVMVSAQQVSELPVSLRAVKDSMEQFGFGAAQLKDGPEKSGQ
jgi:uncharacterized membrane protein